MNDSGERWPCLSWESEAVVARGVDVSWPDIKASPPSAISIIFQSSRVNTNFRHNGELLIVRVCYSRLKKNKTNYSNTRLGRPVRAEYSVLNFASFIIMMRGFPSAYPGRINRKWFFLYNLSRNLRKISFRNNTSINIFVKYHCGKTQIKYIFICAHKYKGKYHFSMKNDKATINRRLGKNVRENVVFLCKIM